MYVDYCTLLFNDDDKDLHRDDDNIYNDSNNRRLFPLATLLLPKLHIVSQTDNKLKR